jgi:myo-inositol catabolism protein IolS
MKISRIGMGTWGLGGVYYGKVPLEQGVAAVRAYIDAGGRHMDTAFAYHQSEDIIGAAIKPYRREEFFITSKTYAGCDNRAEIPKVRTDLEISLRDLGTDYVDCYMIHGSPTDEGHMLALADMFDQLKAEGKIRSVGASIRGPTVTDVTRDTAIMYARSGRMDVIQLTYSIARQKHLAAIAAAGKNNVGLIARWVLESGMLAGKYPIGHEFVWPDTRNRYRTAERDAILQVGLDIQKDLPPGFKHAAEVAIAFALAEPAVTGIVLGANTPEQVRRNCDLDRLPPLPPDYLQKLKDAYWSRNDMHNPTGEFEHVPSPRRPLEK